MITCYIQYKLDMNQLDAFSEYGRIWIELVNLFGGTHHGYFLPNQEEQAKEYQKYSFPGKGTEGPHDVGVAIFSFPSWEIYEQFRSEVANHEACKRATKIVNDTNCFISYQRHFMHLLAPNVMP